MLIASRVRVQRDVEGDSIPPTTSSGSPLTWSGSSCPIKWPVPQTDASRMLLLLCRAPARTNNDSIFLSFLRSCLRMKRASHACFVLFLLRFLIPTRTLESFFRARRIPEFRSCRKGPITRALLDCLLGTFQHLIHGVPHDGSQWFLVGGGRLYQTHQGVSLEFFQIGWPTHFLQPWLDFGSGEKPLPASITTTSFWPSLWEVVSAWKEPPMLASSFSCSAFWSPAQPQSLSSVIAGFPLLILSQRWISLPCSSRKTSEMALIMVSFFSVLSVTK